MVVVAVDITIAGISVAAPVMVAVAGVVSPPLRLLSPVSDVGTVAKGEGRAVVVLVAVAVRRGVILGGE